jgi:putative glutamine amidotransferase
MPATPRIGITMSATVSATPERAYVNAAYIRAVQEAGGVPVLLPPQLGAEGRETLWPWLDGVLLTGGGDVDPALFGEAPHPAVYDVVPSRDSLELDLTRQALDRRLPLLAICRGIQVLNVALGGTLQQDIPSGVPGALPHTQTAPRSQPTHRVKVEDGTRLARILAASEIEVNSFHHQALARLGDGLRAVAWSPDGVVEGAEMDETCGFVIAVQWHPEDLTAHDATARNLFRALVNATRALR